MLPIRPAALLVATLACSLVGCAASATHYSLPAVGDLAVPSGEADPAAPAAQAAEDDWQFELAPYIWFVNINGHMEVKGNKSDVDVDFSDLWDNLDYGALVAFKAHHDDWTFILDTIYLDVHGDGNVDGVQIDADQKTTLITLTAEHPFVAPDSLHWFVGARYWNVEGELGAEGFGNFEGSKHWVDPIVGLKQTWELGDDWSLEALGDYGGFNIGSDRQWEAAALANWAFSPSGVLYFGYRAISVNYDDGNGADRFEFNNLVAGPIVGGGWRF